MILVSHISPISANLQGLKWELFIGYRIWFFDKRLPLGIALSSILVFEKWGGFWVIGFYGCFDWGVRFWVHRDSQKVNQGVRVFYIGHGLFGWFEWFGGLQKDKLYVILLVVLYAFIDLNDKKRLQIFCFGRLKELGCGYLVKYSWFLPRIFGWVIGSWASDVLS